MRLPFVARATYMLMVHAANQAALDREHERTERRRTEGRYDDLLHSYMALRREGFSVPPIVPMPDTDEAVPVSVDDADDAAATRQPQRWLADG